MAFEISVQLWSVRDACKADLAGTLKAIARLGYSAVEFAGFHGHSPSDVRRMLDDAGLKCSGAHIGIDLLEGAAFDETVAACKTVGIEFPIVPGLKPELRNTPDACRQTAERFSKIAERLAPLGLRTGYHLHDADVKPLSEGKSAWDHFIRLTPASFLMQHDTGNAMHGGSTATGTIESHPGRCVSVHFKEFPLDGRVIGEGEVPWPKVVELCRRAGTKWAVIEHEIYAKHEPMKAIELALAGLKRFI